MHRLFAASFGDTVRIHDKISRNCIDIAENRAVTGEGRVTSCQLVVTHTRGGGWPMGRVETKFSRTCRRDVRDIQIVLA